MSLALRRTCKVADERVQDLVRRGLEAGALPGKRRRSRLDGPVPVCLERSGAHSSKLRSCKDKRQFGTEGPGHTHTLQSLSQESRTTALPRLPAIPSSTVTAVIRVRGNRFQSLCRIMRSVKLSFPPDTATATWSSGLNMSQ